MHLSLCKDAPLGWAIQRYENIATAPFCRGLIILSASMIFGGGAPIRPNRLQATHASGILEYLDEGRFWRSSTNLEKSKNVINRKIGQGMAPNHPLEELYGRPGFLLKRCHQVSAGIFIDECREFSLTPSQYGCLRALYEFPGIDQIALGRLVGLDRSTAGLVIKTLSQRRLIDRVINRNDKRRMRLKVSADGVHLLRAIGPAVARARERVLGGLPRESRTAFLDMLAAFLAGHDALINVEDVLAGGISANVPEQGAAPRPRGKRRRASVSGS